MTKIPSQSKPAWLGAPVLPGSDLRSSNSLFGDARGVNTPAHTDKKSRIRGAAARGNIKKWMSKSESRGRTS